MYFTTRPDTLFGATYMVLAPEHPLVDLIVTEEQWPAVREYRERTARKSDLERTELAKEKTGVFTGAYAINPVNDEKIPIWIADYVLLGYGTGAIMAVPAHDERDLEFARKFDLADSPGCSAARRRRVDRLRRRRHRDQFSDHRRPPDAAKRIAKSPPGWKNADRGKRAINYKLRDWLFSRQRYWGEPFPIVWESAPDGSSDIIARWTKASCRWFRRRWTITNRPGPASRRWRRRRIGFAIPTKRTRETNTMPQWAGSCWYYLRFCDPQNDAAFRRRGGRTLLDGRRNAKHDIVDRHRQSAPGGVDLVRRRHRARRAASASTRASGTRCSSISATFRRRSRFSDW